MARQVRAGEEATHVAAIHRHRHRQRKRGWPPVQDEHRHCECRHPWGQLVAWREHELKDDAGCDSGYLQHARRHSAEHSERSELIFRRKAPRITAIIVR